MDRALAGAYHESLSDRTIQESLLKALADENALPPPPLTLEIANVKALLISFYQTVQLQKIVHEETPSRLFDKNFKNFKTADCDKFGFICWLGSVINARKTVIKRTVLKNKKAPELKAGSSGAAKGVFFKANVDLKEREAEKQRDAELKVGPCGVYVATWHKHHAVYKVSKHDPFTLKFLHLFKDEQYPQYCNFLDWIRYELCSDYNAILNRFKAG